MAAVEPKGYSTTGPEKSANNKQTTTAPTAINTAAAAGVKMDDGRKNGETSPVETWKPSFNRTQSWNQEDLKRQRVLKDLEATEKTVSEGRDRGFSEVTN